MLHRRVGRLSWGKLYDRPYNRMANRCRQRKHFALLCSDDRPFSALIQEKEEQKREMGERLEVDGKGGKDEMRVKGRMR